jgi:DNA-binding response OmpR family regulator
MYAEYLRHQGFLPIAVSTAAYALTIAHRADVIVTGLLLAGEMDGIEFIRRLRVDGRTKTMPVVVLTACVWRSDRNRALAAGCDLFLPKPCTPELLVSQLRFVLADAENRASLDRKSPMVPHELYRSHTG